MAERPRVLIVDDDPDQAQFLSATLDQDYEISIATGGLDGYALACAERPAVIVLDLMMPTVDGWTVLRKLRNNPTTQNARIVIVTAMDRDTVRGEAARFDVAVVIQKPLDIRQFTTAVKRLVGQ